MYIGVLPKTPSIITPWYLDCNSTMANGPPTISGQNAMFEPLGLFNIGDNLNLVSEDNPEKLEARYGNV